MFFVFCGSKRNKDILTVMHLLFENKAKNMPETGSPKLMCYLMGIVTNVINRTQCVNVIV